MHNSNNNSKDQALEQALSHLYSAEVPMSFNGQWRAAVRREEIIQMKKTPSWNRFWKVAAPVFAALVLVTGSLWAGTMDLSQESEMLAEMPQVARSNMENYDYEVSNAYDEGSISSDSMYSKSTVSGGTGVGAKSMMANTAVGETSDRKLVRTADVTIQSKAFDQDVQSVQTLLDEVGGYVEDLYQYGDIQNDQTRSITLSMRVPSDRLDQFLSGMDAIGRITNRSESRQDMTVQYTDNEARLQTLKEKMTRLNELMAKAEDVSDLIEIETAIADTQYQIDSYETSQRNIDRRVDMSAVSVTMYEETTAQSAAAEDMSLGERIKAGLDASIKGLGKFMRNMLVFIVMALPVLVPVAIIAVIVWLVTRRKRAKRNDHAEGETSHEEE